MLQALAVKALNDLPAKHGKRPNVKNPPLDHRERPHLPASESRIDRLARSTFDLFAIVKRIVDAGGQFRSLAEPWADTATSTGRLMIAVLGGLADVERDLIRTRTAEGRSRAKARGQHMGRPPALTPGRAGDRKPGRTDSRRAHLCKLRLRAPGLAKTARPFRKSQVGRASK